MLTHFLTFHISFSSRDNSIINLPHTIRHHSNLQILLLDNNLLTELPVSLSTLPRLEVLTFSGNILTSPPTTVLNTSVPAILAWLGKFRQSWLGLNISLQRSPGKRKRRRLEKSVR